MTNSLSITSPERRPLRLVDLLPWLFAGLVVGYAMIVGGYAATVVSFETIAVSAAVTQIHFRYAFISIWCFFAAWLSLHICYVLYRLPARSMRAVEHKNESGAT